VNSWKVILATIVIFGTGVMTGGLLVNHVDHSHPRNFRRMEAALPATNSVPQTNGQNQAASKPSRLPEILNKQFLQRLDAELHLTPDQHDAIQKIITDGQNLMHKTMLDARLEIREQLTPEQRSQFDELVKRPQRRSPGATGAPPVLPPLNVPATASTNAPGS
jgi:Spy/CpxP family protein refolding chaperone